MIIANSALRASFRWLSIILYPTHAREIIMKVTRWNPLIITFFQYRSTKRCKRHDKEQNKPENITRLHY